MTARAGPLLVLLAAALAGCGGHRASVADCLNGKGFLVQANASVVRGSSPGGVNFSLTIYSGAGAASRAFSHLSPKTAALVGSGVADFSGDPPTRAGGPAGRLSKSALATIRLCLDNPSRLDG